MIKQPHFIILQSDEESGIYYTLVFRISNKFLSIRIPQILIIFLEILIFSYGIYGIFDTTLSDVKRMFQLIIFFFCYLFLKIIITMKFMVANIDVNRETKEMSVGFFVFLVNYYIFQNLYDNHDLEDIYEHCFRNKELYSDLIKIINFPKEMIIEKTLFRE